MSFEKHSNFNKLANFSEVKFGENKPVLEVELNELQQIQNEARADIVRDSIPSGFVTLGDIDYDYCANNDNQIKLKTESIAYVNGYRITIPKDTIIEIGESDKVREDLVFLEVWKEAVNDIDTLTEYGGENNAVINNPIKDERYPVATSQRVALKYRIRHVADLNFNYSYSSATSSNLHPYIGWNGEKNFSPVYAMGGNNSLECPKQILGEEIFHSACKEWRNVVINDSGLWIAGLPETDERCTKERYKSIDGFVYAIPMFRLKRKPHVGLASPFEYKKIHNQLDPKKFAHLVGQENVEKVHSVDIKGNTYKNYILHNDPIRLSSEGSVTAYATTKICGLTMGETYTFVATNVPDNIYYYLGMSTSEVLIPYTPHTTGGIIIKPFTVNTSYYQNGGNPMPHFRGSSNINAYANTKFLILKGDWSNKTIPNLDYGIQSLGENTNNSITVENNLVEEGTYVHELQNHILPTHPEVTHVTWGEDVVIPPEVEIELKNGEEVIQTITQLPVKLETTGEETLHVKTMKGRTLVNAHPVRTPELAIPNTGVYEPTVSENYIKVKYLGGTISWKYINFKMPNYSLLKPNTKYFVIFEEAKNITHVQLSNGNVSKVCSTQGELQNNWGIITTNDLLDTNEVIMYISFNDKGVVGSETIAKNPMIIEYQEGMENWGLKYFEGMQSVKMPVLKATGKNLFDVNGLKNSQYLKDDGFIYIPIQLKPLTNYTFSDKNGEWNGKGIWLDVFDGEKSLVSIIDSNKVNRKTFSFMTNESLNFWIKSYNSNTDKILSTSSEFQIEEGSQATSYEQPYKSNILRTPSDLELRGVGEVKDELDLMTGEVTQRIDSIILKENCEISLYGGVKGENTIAFRFSNLNINPKWLNVRTKPNLLSTTFPTTTYNNCLSSNFEDKEGMCLDTSNGESTNAIVIRILKSRLISEDVEGVRKFISKNKIDIVSELNTPTIKTVDLTEDDYVGKSKVTYQLAEPLRKVGTYSDFIKGKTLFSNIGVEVLNGSEEWVRSGTDYGFYFNHPNSMPSTPLISPQLPTLNGWENYARKGIFRGGSEAIGLVVSAGDLSENTLQGFKNWLQDNPVTIYYVKANPMEIPLKEVSPLECDFSYHRQFKRGYENYLKELPNGLKDVVENGKVKRNVKHLVVNGTENWTTLSTDGDNVRAFMTLSGARPIARAFNSYDFTHGTAQTDMNILGVDQNGNLVIGILKTLLTSPDVQGIKEYLSRKNLHVIYELQTPTTEELMEENSRYVPYMPLNSYVGSLYVADGINRTKFLTAFSPSEYEVQTYHRYFSNEFNVFEDTTLKKSPYGHKTYLEEVDGKYVEKFIAGLEKHEIEDLRHKVSLTGFDYSQLLQDSFLKLIKGELS